MNMRIAGIFLWVIFGAAVLWLFTLNLDQTVDIDFFNKEFQNVNLVTVVFISIFFGVALGALLILTQFFKVKKQLSKLKRDYDQLLKESEFIQKVSVPKPPAIEKEEQNNQNILNDEKEKPADEE